MSEYTDVLSSSVNLLLSNIIFLNSKLSIILNNLNVQDCKQIREIVQSIVFEKQISINDNYYM